MARRAIKLVTVCGASNVTGIINPIKPSPNSPSIMVRNWSSTPPNWPPLSHQDAGGTRPHRF